MKKKIIYAFICMLIGALGALMLRGVVNTVKYNDSISYIKEAELNYWETKAQLVEEVQNYIDKTAPSSDLRAVALVDACEEHSVDVLFALAQAQCESNFGTKGLAAKTNSVWNVGAYDGKSFKEITGQYKYKHPNESIKPYLDLLVNKYLTIGCEEALMNKYVDKHGKRFASNPDYEERLRNVYKDINNNTQIDSLSAQLRKWAVKANR